MRGVSPGQRGQIGKNGRKGLNSLFSLSGLKYPSGLNYAVLVISTRDASFSKKTFSHHWS